MLMAIKVYHEFQNRNWSLSSFYTFALVAKKIDHTDSKAAVLEIYIFCECDHM